MEYKYIKISDYLKQVEYEFISTYSFNRGKEFDRLVDSLEYTDNDIHSSYLINDLAEFNKTAERISVVRKDSNEFDKLMKIVSVTVKTIPAFMCVPIYRDSLVFYSADNKVIDVLNICFGCDHIENSVHTIVEADETMFVDLANWFKLQGHDIDSNATLKLYRRLGELKKRK